MNREFIRYSEVNLEIGFEGRLVVVVLRIVRGYVCIYRDLVFWGG